MSFQLGFFWVDCAHPISSSKKYRELLQQSRQERLTAAHASLSEGSEAFMPDDRSTSDSTSTWGVVTTGDPQDASSNFADPNLYSSTPWMLSVSISRIWR